MIITYLTYYREIKFTKMIYTEMLGLQFHGQKKKDKTGYGRKRNGGF